MTNAIITLSEKGLALARKLAEAMVGADVFAHSGFVQAVRCGDELPIGKASHCQKNTCRYQDDGK